MAEGHQSGPVRMVSILSDAVTDLIVAHPWRTVLLFVSVGISLTLIYSQRHATKTVEEAAIKTAAAMAQTITASRNFYSREVVDRARKAGVVATHDYRNIPNSIPLPATMTIDWAEEMRRDGHGPQFNLFSDLPFPWRHERKLDDFEQDALRALRSAGDQPFIRFEQVNGEPAIRYAVPMAMEESCVGCHNTYEGTGRYDWRAGDLAGVLQVTLPIPDMFHLGNTHFLDSVAFLLAYGAIGLLCFWLLVKRLHATLEETRRMAINVEEQNLELRHAKAGAEMANRSMSEFLANMSHELRTPLNAVLGFSEIIKGQMLGPVGTPKYLEYASDIHASGAHLLDIIGDILDLSKIEAGRDEVYEEPIDVSAMIDDCIRLIAPRAEQSGVTVLSDVAHGLPVLRGDMRKLKQVFINLLSNAVKFTPAGGRVVLRAKLDHAGSIVVSVQDNGIGMRSEDIPKALAPFTQVEGPMTRRHEGTGLGLPLSRGLCALHGANLHIASQLDVGTTVTVTFPPARTVTRGATLEPPPAPTTETGPAAARP